MTRSDPGRRSVRRHRPWSPGSTPGTSPPRPGPGRGRQGGRNLLLRSGRGSDHRELLAEGATERCHGHGDPTRGAARRPPAWSSPPRCCPCGASRRARVSPLTPDRGVYQAAARPFPLPRL